MVPVCLSEYDLVCDECRKEFERIFSTENKAIRQESELLAKWFKSLCKKCRQILKDEGFIT